MSFEWTQNEQPLFLHVHDVCAYVGILIVDIIIV